jgi:hypothetical protein
MFGIALSLQRGNDTQESSNFRGESSRAAETRGRS